MDCRVRTHESDSEVTVHRPGKIIQRIFFAQSAAAIAESLGNGLERVVSQGLLNFYRKLSPLRFLPGLLRFAPTKLSLGLRGCPNSCSYVFKMTILHIRSGCQWFALGYPLLLFKTCRSVNFVALAAISKSVESSRDTFESRFAFCYFFDAKKSGIQVKG